MTDLAHPQIRYMQSNQQRTPFNLFLKYSKRILFCDSCIHREHRSLGSGSYSNPYGTEPELYNAPKFAMY